jgi:uncharacterized protein YndB with AHSA1/START domain
MSVTHAEFTLERRYPYTPAQTFSAFAEPELRRQWFANPGGWDDAEWALDFRVGGGERNRGGGRAYESRFHDIVDGERIVYAYDLFHGGRLISVSLATVEFGGEGGGTALRLTEQGVFFDGEVAAAQREHGTGKLLDALGRFLAGEPVR